METQLSLPSSGFVAAHAHLGTEWHLGHTAGLLNMVCHVLLLVKPINYFNSSIPVALTICSLKGDMGHF
jgi:hypothetical protein